MTVFCSDTELAAGGTVLVMLGDRELARTIGGCELRKDSIL